MVLILLSYAQELARKFQNNIQTIVNFKLDFKQKKMGKTTKDTDDMDEKPVVKSLKTKKRAALIEM